jgi:hypothetical protein
VNKDALDGPITGGKGRGRGRSTAGAQHLVNRRNHPTAGARIALLCGWRNMGDEPRKASQPGGGDVTALGGRGFSGDETKGA